MAMMKHALIGGGTGFIGRNLVKHLNQNGYDVTIVSRMPGLRCITWHELEKNGIPNEITAVVNLAGQNTLDPTRRWTEGFKQNVWNSRINTTSAMVKAIEAAQNVKAFVNISGVGHYQPNDDKIYTELDDVQQFDYMSKLAVAWEKAAILAPDVSLRTRSVIIRSGVVVGRGGGMIQSIWLPFYIGLGGPMGNGKQILPWIHLNDTCRLILHAIENENAWGVLNGVAPEILTNAEFSKTFATAMHRPCLLPVPQFVVRAIFGEDRSALLLTGAKIQPKRTLDSGFQFKYPTAKAACEEIIKGPLPDSKDKIVLQ